MFPEMATAPELGGLDPDEEEFVALSTIPAGAEPSVNELPHWDCKVELEEPSRPGNAEFTVL